LPSHPENHEHSAIQISSEVCSTVWLYRSQALSWPSCRVSRPHMHSPDTCGAAPPRHGCLATEQRSPFSCRMEGRTRKRNSRYNMPEQNSIKLGWRGNKQSGHIPQILLRCQGGWQVVLEFAHPVAISVLRNKDLDMTMSSAYRSFRRENSKVRCLAELTVDSNDRFSVEDEYKLQNDHDLIIRRRLICGSHVGFVLIPRGLLRSRSYNTAVFIRRGQREKRGAPPFLVPGQGVDTLLRLRQEGQRRGEQDLLRLVGGGQSE
jgi:hypothetical protein